MTFSMIIAVKFFVGFLLLDGCSSRPLDNEADYRQYQNNAGNSYTPPLMSPSSYGTSQNGLSSLGNSPGIFLPQSIPPSSLNTYGNPFGGQLYAGGNYPSPGAGYPWPNYYG